MLAALCDGSSSKVTASFHGKKSGEMPSDKSLTPRRSKSCSTPSKSPGGPRRSRPRPPADQSTAGRLIQSCSTSLRKARKLRKEDKARYLNGTLCTLRTLRIADIVFGGRKWRSAASETRLQGRG